MASSKRWSRLKLGALAALILLLGGCAYLVSRAAALNEDTIRADIVDQLAAWSGGEVELNGPVRLHYFPDLAVTAGSFHIKNTPHLPHVDSIAASAIRVELGLRSLILPEAILHRIELTGLDVLLHPSVGKPDTAKARAKISLFLEALRSLPIPEMSVIDGAIGLPGDIGGAAFSAVNASASLSGSGIFKSSGSIVWRGQPLNYSVRASIPGPAKESTTSPLTLSLNGPLVTAEVEGDIAITDGMRGMGTLNLQIPDLRRFTQWMGLLTPEGPGLGLFQASGGFRWGQHRLGFDEGQFTLDGNRALGALTLDFGGIRPLVSGTLAFSSFDVGPYAAKTEAASAGDAATTARKPVSANFPLLHHLDLDLRLSTSTVETPLLTLGQVAMSATAKAGRLSADFAILDLCGGNGNGRMDFDAAAPQAAVRLTGNFNRLTAQTCLRLAFGNSPITANLDLLVDVASKGRTGRDILKHLNGKVSVESAGGTLAFDAAALKAGAAPVRLEGWGPLTGNSTPFTNLQTELVFRQGDILAERLKFHANALQYGGHGIVDMEGGTLDFSLLAVPPGSGASSRGGQTPNAQIYARLSGPWLAPSTTITHEPPAQTGAEQPGGRESAPVR